MNKEDEIRKKFTLAEKLFAEKNVEDSIKLYLEILSLNLPLGRSRSSKELFICFKDNSSFL